jgi:hypothetical protein
MRRFAAFALFAAAAAAVFAIRESGSSPARGEPRASTAGGHFAGLHVAGNRLLSGSGLPVRLHGVNRSGTEYACIQGAGIFDGPSGASSLSALRSWNVNIVRVPINEDCWLGINRVAARLSGQRYRSAIVNYVRLLHRYGMYAEISLIWGAPGSYRATYQSGGPDADHAPAVWSGLARAFKRDHRVILAPWGETVVNGRCFLQGGVCEATYGPHNVPYRIAGMQQAVDVMRGAGYRGVIAIPGIDYANNLSRWLSDEPKDPLHQLIAEAHVYGKNTCDTTSCFDSSMAPVAARVPLIFGETGETFDGSDCGSSYISTFLNWADQHGVGYETWTWDVWHNCESLISSYRGTPANGYGAYVMAHYAALG